MSFHEFAGIGGCALNHSGPAFKKKPVQRQSNSPQQTCGKHREIEPRRPGYRCRRDSERERRFKTARGDVVAPRVLKQFAIRHIRRTRRLARKASHAFGRVKIRKLVLRQPTGGFLAP